MQGIYIYVTKYTICRHCHIIPYNCFQSRDKLTFIIRYVAEITGKLEGRIGLHCCSYVE